MQSIFQVNHDFGHAPDHAREFSKLIITTKRDERLFTASYTIVNMLGKIICSRFTCTKSNEELEPIIEGIKKAKGMLGLEKLKRTT